jgi:cyclopropane fatty-acyl-phospholipid synthase-like methyltransferase
MLDKDEVRRFYDDMWSRFGRDLNRHERDRFGSIVSILEGLERPNPAILDAGCGLGKLSERLAAYGQVTGVDWSETAVTAARARVPGAEFFTVDLVRDDVTPFRDRFGLAVSTEVLEHVGRENRLGLLENLRSCLVPNGFLILTTPNREVSERLPDPEEWRQPEDDLLSVDETLEVIRQARFRVLRQGSATFLETLWEGSPKFRWLRSRFGRDRLNRDFIDRLLSSTRLGLYTVVLASREP